MKLVVSVWMLLTISGGADSPVACKYLLSTTNAIPLMLELIPFQFRHEKPRLLGVTGSAQIIVAFSPTTRKSVTNPDSRSPPLLPFFAFDDFHSPIALAKSYSSSCLDMVFN